jgi:hypothetical protein
MRWKNRFWAVMFLVATSGVIGRPSSIIVIEALREFPSFMEEALQALKGRTLNVRVYQNLSVDPEKYIKVSVPVSSGRLQLSAIKKSYPSVSRLSYVFCRASDQADQAAARALEGIVFLIPYSDQAWPSVLTKPGLNNKPPNPYWTFLDAQGIPMAGASVEIRIANHLGGLRFMSDDSAYASSIYVGESTLDDKGRLKGILRS